MTIVLKTVAKRNVLLGTGISILAGLVHSYILFANFVEPSSETIKKNNIQIILLNQSNKIAESPLAKLYANASSNGGGEKAEGHRTSPLDASPLDKNGDSLVEQEKVIIDQEKELSQKLETIREITAQQSKMVKAFQGAEKKKHQELLSKIQRKQAEIEEQIADYNARPKKYFDGPHTSLHEAAIYVDQWKTKVETWGNQFYPEEARGKIYGDVILTVEIHKSGRPALIQVEKSSGYSILDQAAVESVKKSGPFQKFNETMAQKMDILVITRTWTYGPDGLSTKKNDR